VLVLFLRSERNRKDEHKCITFSSVFLGKALESAGVVSSNDMTLEAISCKVAYLMGRGDLSIEEIGKLMCVSLRGEGKSICEAERFRAD
jgi:hypothetical protein